MLHNQIAARDSERRRVVAYPRREQSKYRRLLAGQRRIPRRERPAVQKIRMHTGGIMNYIYSTDDVAFGEKTVTVVYKELASSFWDKVLGDNRCAPIAKENSSTCYVESRKIMRFVIAHRNEKRLYVFPTDQCPYRYASAHTVDNFMHQPTVTMTGGATLASIQQLR